MKAWIEGKKRTGPWKVRWREFIDGKWVKRASATFGDVGSAEQELAAVNLRLAKLTALRPRRGASLLPLGHVIERWKSAKMTSGKVNNPYYANGVERFTKAISEAQGWTTTAHVTADALDAWRASKPKGTARPLAMFKAVLRYARNVLKQPIDPDVLDMPIPQAPPRPAPALLSDEHTAAIIARAFALGERYGAAVEHLTLFGCRPSDLCRLNVGDWDPATRMLTLQITKSGTRPRHPITGPFADHAKRLDRLVANRPASEPLFQNPQGGRWQLSEHTGAARQLADWYWIHITYHLPQIPLDRRCISALKDYAISSLDAAGVDDRTKTIFTGHKSLSVYARYKTSNEERATAALDQLGAYRSRGGKSGGSSKLRGQNRGQKRRPTQTSKMTPRGKTSKKRRA